MPVTFGLCFNGRVRVEYELPLQILLRNTLRLVMLIGWSKSAYPVESLTSAIRGCHAPTPTLVCSSYSGRESACTG